MMAFSSMTSNLCLVVAVFCMVLNVEAREGKLFFSKFTHHTTHKNVSPTPVPSDSPSLSPAPSPAQVGGGGLRAGQFGPGSGMIPQTRESWPTTDEFDKLLDKFDGKTKNDETNRLEGENYTTDRLEEVNYEDEGSEYYNPSEQRRNYYYTNNRYTYNYNDNESGHAEERQGTSDTRFLDNGRYFHDVKGENYGNDPSRYGVGERDEGFERNWNARKYSNAVDSMEVRYKSLEVPQASLP